MPYPVRLIAFACVDGNVYEAIGHVNAALVAARISPDNSQAKGFLVKRAELVRILRADSDVSDLHSVRHKLLLSGLDRRLIDNKPNPLSTKTQRSRLMSKLGGELASGRCKKLARVSIG